MLPAAHTAPVYASTQASPYGSQDSVPGCQLRLCPGRTSTCMSLPAYPSATAPRRDHTTTQTQCAEDGFRPVLSEAEGPPPRSPSHTRGSDLGRLSLSKSEARRRSPLPSRRPDTPVGHCRSPLPSRRPDNPARPEPAEGSGTAVRLCRPVGPTILSGTAVRLCRPWERSPDRDCRCLGGTARDALSYVEGRSRRL